MSYKNILYPVIIIGVIFGVAEMLLAAAGIKPLILTRDPLVGFAGNIPQFVKATRNDGVEMFITPRNKLDYFNFQEFPQQKSADAYRIFCIGGSTTFGRPYSHKVSFCGWMQSYLEAADPSRRWEVVNVGGITYASYRVARMMNELVDYEPDLFIIYTGQNEFLEERSYGALQNLPTWVIELDAGLSGTRVYTAMKLALDVFREGRNDAPVRQPLLPEETDDIMSHTMGPTSYHRDENLREKIIAHYRINLKRIAALADSVDAAKLFVVPAIKVRDMTPVKSEHRNDIQPDQLVQWQTIYAAARKRQQAGELDAALAQYREAMVIDDRYAELHYRIGEILFERRLYDKAEAAFRRAVLEDVAPLRILPSMQQIVRDVAASEDAPLIDFPVLLGKVHQQQYGHTVFGNEYFVDHVHFNIEGHRMIGRELFDTLVAQGIASPDDNWSEARAAEVEQAVLAGIDKEDIGTSFLALGIILEWSAKYEEAVVLLERALDYLGPGMEVYSRLVRAHYALGNRDRAYDYLVKARELNPKQRSLHSRIARFLLDQGKPEEAMEECRKEIEYHPDNYFGFFCLAMTHVKTGETGKARGNYEKALELEPKSASLLRSYARFLTEQQRYDEAVRHARAAVEINSSDYRARYILGSLLLRLGETDEALQQVKEALRLEPGYEPAMEIMRRISSGQAGAAR